MTDTAQARATRVIDATIIYVATEDDMPSPAAIAARCRTECRQDRAPEDAAQAVYAIVADAIPEPAGQAGRSPVQSRCFAPIIKHGEGATNPLERIRHENDSPACKPQALHQSPNMEACPHPWAAISLDHADNPSRMAWRRGRCGQEVSRSERDDHQSPSRR